MTRAKPGEAQRALADLLALETDECVIWPHAKTEQGYGIAQNKRVHRTACALHYGPCPPGREVAHSCHTRACLNYRHLRWAVHAENIAERFENGTGKLSPDNVLDIRGRLAAGEQQGPLAEAYGVNPSMISHINTGRKWAWVQHSSVGGGDAPIRPPATSDGLVS